MSAVAKIAKPAMRGMHIASIKKNLVMATVVSWDIIVKSVSYPTYFSQVATVASTAWYLGVNKPRKEAYANFYATYDADKDFQRMLVRFKFQFSLSTIVSHNYYLLYLFCQGCNVFQSQAIIAEKAAEAGGEEEEE